MAESTIADMMDRMGIQVIQVSATIQITVIRPPKARMRNGPNFLEVATRA
jgi:hypothetical protein